jgi:hypothetical protein
LHDFDGWRYVHTSDTVPPYRIFGRWVQGAGYRYRAEFSLPTGWWPVGEFEMLREARLASLQHYESSQEAARLTAPGQN